MQRMTDRNPHTGEKLQSKANSDNYRDGYERIFGEIKQKPCRLALQYGACCMKSACIHRFNEIEAKSECQHSS